MIPWHLYGTLQFTKHFYFTYTSLLLENLYTKYFKHSQTHWHVWLNNKGHHLSSICWATVIEYLLPLISVTILQGSSTHIFKIRTFWEVKTTRPNDPAGIQIWNVWFLGQALLYTHDHARSAHLLSVWGAWYHYPSNLSDTYWVFAASKTQDQCTRHLLWSWDIICWPISFALFWPNSWAGVSVLSRLLSLD